MSDDTPMGRLKTKVESDGNGGLQLKEPAIELIRKWLSPALLALLVWAGKGMVAELIALHDGQLRMEVRVEKIEQRLQLDGGR